ncbi:MAG: transporter [Verrucomicrobiota bacterium]
MDNPLPDKSAFSIFNPAPAALMRELATDRPDKTESPHTVDAGHFQIEMDLLSYVFDRYNSDRRDVRTESFGFATTNLKMGLCSFADFQLLVPAYNRVHFDDRASGRVMNHSGFGDLVARTKINLWGNAAGSTAFGVMPFIKFPSNQDDLGNNSVEAGLILPLSVQWPGGWQMGVMTELDLNRDESGSGHHAEFVNSITFSHELIGKLDGYAEFFSAVSAEAGADWIGTVDLGLVYALTENVQLDAGINLGITRAADDFNPFVGITFRF